MNASYRLCALLIVQLIALGQSDNSHGQERVDVDATIDLIPPTDLRVFTVWKKEKPFRRWLEEADGTPGAVAYYLLERKTQDLKGLDHCSVINGASGWYEFASLEAWVEGVDVLQFSEDDADRLADWFSESSRERGVAEESAFLAFPTDDDVEARRVYVFLIGKTRIGFSSSLEIAKRVTARAETNMHEDTIRSYPEWVGVVVSDQPAGFRHYAHDRKQVLINFYFPEPDTIGFAFSRLADDGFRVTILGETHDGAMNGLMVWKDISFVISNQEVDGSVIRCEVHLGTDDDSADSQFRLLLLLGFQIII